jgi:hypothetical protein
MGEMPTCSTGRGGVVLDAVVAGALGIGAIAALADDSPGGALAAALIGGVFVGSAVVGHRAANRCEEAMDGFQQELVELRERSTAAAAATATATATAVALATAGEAGAAVGAASEGAESEGGAEVVADPNFGGRLLTAPGRSAPREEPPPPPGRETWADFWIEVKP